MPTPPWIASRVKRRNAFTLIEVLVAMTVLVLLVGLIAQLTGGVASIIGRGQAHIDTDGQARALLDRMAIDFGAMVKRPDVDYYLKGRPAALKQTGNTALKKPGNDQIAFYSEVPGYFPAGATAQSAVSLVAYRVNSATLHMERLCRGLAWNGDSSAANTMSFLPVPLASALPSPLPSPTPADSPAPVCPLAADPTTADKDYEEMGPQVFRFEYYYVLKGQNAASSAPTLSVTPCFATRPADQASVNGMQDVAGIGVVIAVLDPKGRVLISEDQLAALAAQMPDAPDPAKGETFANGDAFLSPGDIEKQWTAAVDNSPLPRRALAAIRIYTRCFYLNGVPP